MLNARAEDPALWDDPQGAQAVMRERTRLDAAIGGCREFERELADNVEFAELGAEEGDDAVVDDALAALRGLAARALRARMEALLSG